MSNEPTVRLVSEAEVKFTNLGHAPENKSCDHTQWSFERHGRYCPCGTIMVDFGD